MNTDKELELLRDLVSRLFDDYAGIFICGESAEVDKSGMPTSILVCPSEGVDEVRVYDLRELRSSKG